MSKSSLFSILSTAALSLGLTIPASAATLSITGGTAPGDTVTTFGSTLASSTPGTWTGIGSAGTADTSVVNSYLDPLGSGTTAYYGYAEQGAIVDVNFASASGVSLLWGSPDAYNTLTLYSGANETGTATVFTPGSGAALLLTPGSSASSFVNITGGIWDSASFASSQNSFEFADFATAAAPAPEPASIALLAGGLLAIGAGAIRRRRKS